MSNKAAWIVEAGGKRLEVKEAPMPTAGPNEIVIKNHALAINPVDWMVQDFGIIISKYPTIVGEDVAGEVHEVGEGVTHVKKGDRVLGHATVLLSQNAANGGFQLYTIVDALLVVKIPSAMTFAEASVFPLAISTTALCLFSKDTMALPYPTPSPPNTGKSILVWGGASSIGAIAIQLAVAAGVKVVTVASKHNLEKLLELGASAAFDYKSPTVISDILAALDGTSYAGICDCVGTPDVAAAWTPIYERLGGRLGTVMPEPKGLPEGIQGKDVMAACIATQERDVGEPVWGQWVGRALESGQLKPRPDPIVVGKGLESLQEAVERHKKGVSFAKIVVEL